MHFEVWEKCEHKCNLRPKNEWPSNSPGKSPVIRENYQIFGAELTLVMATTGFTLDISNIIEVYNRLHNQGASEAEGGSICHLTSLFQFHKQSVGWPENNQWTGWNDMFVHKQNWWVKKNAGENPWKNPGSPVNQHFFGWLRPHENSQLNRMKSGYPTMKSPVFHGSISPLFMVKLH